jgi:hypothetical protein
MMRYRHRARVVVAAAVLALIVGVSPNPAHAQYAGCYTGQVGLYTQYNGAGHCYGFSGTNNSFATWGINDSIRSGKNIGLTGMRALVYRDTFYSGGVALCLARWEQRNNPNAPQGASNAWTWALC